MSSDLIRVKEELSFYLDKMNLELSFVTVTKKISPSWELPFLCSYTGDIIFSILYSFVAFIHLNNILLNTYPSPG